MTYSYFYIFYIFCHVCFLMSFYFLLLTPELGICPSFGRSTSVLQAPQCQATSKFCGVALRAFQTRPARHSPLPLCVLIPEPKPVLVSNTPAL